MVGEPKLGFKNPYEDQPFLKSQNLYCALMRNLGRNVGRNVERNVGRNVGRNVERNVEL